MLHILSNEGYELATVLLQHIEDIDLMKELFLQYRELEAKSRSLFQACLNGDRSKIKAHLIDLYVLFSPVAGSFSLGSQPIKDISVNAE